MGASAQRVAAEPDRLRRYSERTVAGDHQVRALGLTRLRASLERLRVTRSEGVGAVAGLEWDVASWAGAAANADDEAAHVATRFEQADTRAWTGLPLVVRELRDRRGAATDPWEPTARLTPLQSQRWTELVHGPDWPCVAGSGRYAGGGGIVGPDGLVYPLVVPKLTVDGRVYEGTAFAGAGVPEVATLGGADPGWVRVDSRSGVMRHLPEPGGWDRFFVFWTGLNPNLAPRSRPASRDVVSSVLIGPDGYPRWQGPDAARHAPSEGPPTAPPSMDLPSLGVVVIDGQPTLIDTRTLHELPREVRRGAARLGIAPSRQVARTNAAMGAVDLATGALQGLDVAASLEDGGLSGYQVVFEVHEDGRRRAMFRTYRTRVDGESLVATPFHASLDEDGELTYDQLRFFRGPVISPSGPPPLIVTEPFSDEDR